MKAPNEIYVPLVDMGIEEGGIQPAAIWWDKDKSAEKKDCKGAVKYIRADLTEPTWIDIRNILIIADEIERENETLPILKSELCEEALRRFMKQRVNTTRKL